MNVNGLGYYLITQVPKYNGLITKFNSNLTEI